MKKVVCLCLLVASIVTTLSTLVFSETDASEIVGAAKELTLYYLSNTEISFTPKTKTLTISGNGGSSMVGEKTSIALDLINLFDSLPDVERIKYTSYAPVENEYGEKKGKKTTFSTLAYRVPFARMKKSGLTDKIDLSDRSVYMNTSQDEMEIIANRIIRLMSKR